MSADSAPLVSEHQPWTVGAPADLILVDPAMPWICDGEKLRSRSKNTPFEGARFEGRVLRTIVAGRTVYEYAAN